MQDLLDFDFTAIEKRLDEMSRKSRALCGPRYGSTYPALLPASGTSQSDLLSGSDNGSSGTSSEVLPSLSTWLAETETALHQSQTAQAAGMPSTRGSSLSVPPSGPSAGASVIPSRVDLLKARATEYLASRSSQRAAAGQDASSAHTAGQAESDSVHSLPLSSLKAETGAMVPAAAPSGSQEDDERAESMLEELMKPSERKPYREFKKSMDEADDPCIFAGNSQGAVPSLEAARAALESFQNERVATLGTVSEPLARAQAQLATLEATLKKPSQLDTSSLSTSDRLSMRTANSSTSLPGSESARPHLEAARRSREARKAAWDKYRSSECSLPDEFKRRMDEVYNPSEEHTAAVAEAVKLGVEDFKAGRVATRSEAVKARVSEVYKRKHAASPPLFGEDTFKRVQPPASGVYLYQACFGICWSLCAIWLPKRIVCDM